MSSATRGTAVPGGPPPASWAQVEAAAPDLAAAVEARLRAHKHHVLATLRRDGSPRVSGTEVSRWRGDLALGSMPGSAKARDLLRDPRFALHAHTGDGSMSGGDAKLSGVAVEVTDPAELAEFAATLEEPVPGPFHLFRLHPTDVVHTSIAPDGSGLLVRWWTPRAGLREVVRT
ncbi:pyridoxamine 5'-phosphate oxidase family protein [Kineococcus sp. NUM-3379]